LERPWRSWRHITKLDPARRHTEEHIRALRESGTDALMIGGTQNVTRAKVRALLERVRGLGLPILLEPSSAKNVVYEGADYLFVPLVLNAREPRWAGGEHAAWMAQLVRKGLAERLPWERVVPEGYIVLNPRAAVAKVTRSRTRLSREEVLGYALLADRYLRLPIVYLEYSGAFGDPGLVKEVRALLRNSHLFYGGGIDSAEKARAMAAHATIVVGNVLYADTARYRETALALRRGVGTPSSSP